MSAMIRCLTATLLVFSFSGAAVAQVEPVDPTQAVLGQWGDNVVVTSVLTRGQSLETLFSNSLLVSDMVAQWKQNFDATPPAVGEALEIKAALNMLVRAFDADRRLNWTAQDVLVGKWADLPGSPVIKKKIRAAFEILKADGLMCLSFLNRFEEEEAPQELVTALINVLGNPRLSVLTHLDLYTTCASVEVYSDADLDLLTFAMDEVQLIRTEAPNGGTQTIASSTSTMSASGASVVATGFCCSRLTRTCVAGGATLSCNVCVGKCCLGSLWCVA